MLLWLHWDGPSSAEDAAQGAGAAEPDAAALTMQCGPGLDHQELFCIARLAVATR